MKYRISIAIIGSLLASGGVARDRSSSLRALDLANSRIDHVEVFGMPFDIETDEQIDEETLKTDYEFKLELRGVRPECGRRLKNALRTVATAKSRSPRNRDLRVSIQVYTTGAGPPMVFNLTQSREIIFDGRAMSAAALIAWLNVASRICF